MGDFVSKINNLLFGPNYYKVLMLGLYFNGKTTILNKIKHKERIKYGNCIRWILEILFYKGILKTLSWTIGGLSRIIELYKPFYPNTDGILLVIDSNDKERLDHAIESFE